MRRDVIEGPSQLRRSVSRLRSLGDDRGPDDSSQRLRSIRKEVRDDREEAAREG
jgi:hypothetical protein